MVSANALPSNDGTPITPFARGIYSTVAKMISLSNSLTASEAEAPSTSIIAEPMNMTATNMTNEGFSKIMGIFESTTTLLATSTTPYVAAAAESQFLGISVAAWITMLGVVCGVIAIALILVIFCCLCCLAAGDSEEDKKKTQKNSPPAATTTAAPSTEPVATETVVEKHINHLPDGRKVTTVTSVRTTTSSDGSKNRKTSRVQLLSQKSSSKKPRRHHHHQHANSEMVMVPSERRQNRHQHPPIAMSDRAPLDRRQPYLPLQRRQAPRSSTVVEMEPVGPQAPNYFNGTQMPQQQPSSRQPDYPSSNSFNVQQQHSDFSEM